MQRVISIVNNPQHIPLLLLERMPPIIAALIDAGSGPIFFPNGFKWLFTCAPIIRAPLLLGCVIQRLGVTPVLY